MAVPFINNQVSVSYEYETGEEKERHGNRYVEFSNIEALHIRENPNPKVKVKKIASRKEVAPEDTITYTITFLNAGNVSVTKFYVKERIDDSCYYIGASFELLLETEENSAVLREYESDDQAENDMYFPEEIRYKAAYQLIEYGTHMIESMLEDTGLTYNEVRELHSERRKLRSCIIRDEPGLNAAVMSGGLLQQAIAAIVRIYWNHNSSGEDKTKIPFSALSVQELVLGMKKHDTYDGENVDSILEEDAAYLLENSIKSIRSAIMALRQVVLEEGESGRGRTAREQCNQDSELQRMLNQLLTYEKNIKSNRDQISTVYEQLEKEVMDILPEGRYQRVENVYCRRQDCIVWMQALSDMLKEIPVKGGKKESRLGILLFAAEAAIAAADSLAVSIQKEESEYKEQITEWRNQMDEARIRLLCLTGEISNDEFSEIISGSIKKLYNLILNMQEQGIKNEMAVENIMVKPVYFPYRPTTAYEDAVSRYGLPDGQSPAKDGMTVFQVLQTERKEAASAASYGIVPLEAKKIQEVKGNREIHFHMNGELQKIDMFMINFRVKVAGNETSRDGLLQGLEYQPNIDMMNKEEIINRVSVGFQVERPEGGYYFIKAPDFEHPKIEIADSDGREYDSADGIFPEIKVSDLTSVVKSKVKFARLCLSREVFYSGSGIPIAGDEKVKSGVPLCFLITIRNYGNIEAQHVRIQEIYDGFTSFIQRKQQMDPSVPVQCKDFLYKVYNPSDEKSDAYHTDVNNENGCIPVMAYIGNSPDFDVEAKDYAQKQQLESPYGCIIISQMIVLNDITVPARAAGSRLKTECSNTPGYAQKDSINDGVVGVVEIRCYEMVADII